MFTSLASVKHLVVAARERPSVPAGELHALVQPAVGALRIFGLPNQAALLERWREMALQALADHDGRPPESLLAPVAETLLAVERHLGSLIGREPRQDAALPGVERRLRLLETAVRRTPARAGATRVLDAAPVAPRPAEPAADDADVVAVFMAECDELVEEIRGAAVAWTDDPADRDALLELRRAFHTLKGSGRLMGAGNLAELSMAVEKLLGRVVDGTLAPGPGLHDALGAACQLLPRVIVAPGRGEEPAAVDEVVARLDRLRDGVATPTSESPAADAVAAAGAGGRPRIRLAGSQPLRVFLEEAGEILDGCDAIMQMLKRSPGDAAAINELRREVHTLKGSAHVAGLTALGDLAHAMESALAMLADGSASSSLAFLALMEECLDRFADQLDLVRAGRQPATVGDLVGRIEGFVGGGSVEPATADVPSITLPLVLRATGGDRDDRIQVPVGLLDRLTGLAGELGVTHTQTAEGLGTLRASLAEMRRNRCRVNARPACAASPVPSRRAPRTCTACGRASRCTPTPPRARSPSSRAPAPTCTTS